MASKTREDVKAVLADLSGREWSTELAHEIARIAHDGVDDKIGQPYIDHPAALVALVAEHGESAQQVAWPYDTVEDTAWTLNDLRAAGAPDAVVLSVIPSADDLGGSRQFGFR